MSQKRERKPLVSEESSPESEEDENNEAVNDQPAIERMARLGVRALLAAECSKRALNQADLMRLVGSQGRSTTRLVMDRIKSMLRMVFGFDLVKIPANPPVHLGEAATVRQRELAANQHESPFLGLVSLLSPAMRLRMYPKSVEKMAGEEDEAGEEEEAGEEGEGDDEDLDGEDGHDHIWESGVSGWDDRDRALLVIVISMLRVHGAMSPHGRPEMEEALLRRHLESLGIGWAVLQEHLEGWKLQKYLVTVRRPDDLDPNLLHACWAVGGRGLLEVQPAMVLSDWIQRFDLADGPALIERLNRTLK